MLSDRTRGLNPEGGLNSKQSGDIELLGFAT